MQEENITSEALGDASQLNAAPASEAVGSAPASPLEQINQRLGKQYPDMETALKSIDDTFSYVGKKRDDIVKEVTPTLPPQNDKTEAIARELEEMRKERFYDKNPQYADTSIRKFIESTGKNPAEVVNSQEFQDIFQKISGFDESQKLKTVLESNPRLASSQDSLAKAREALATKGKSEEVDALATAAVRDAYGL